MQILKVIIHLALFAAILGGTGCSNKRKGDEERTPAQTIEIGIQEAQELMKARQTQKALQILEGLMDVDPKNASVLEALAFGYSDAGDPGLAAFFFEQIVGISPTQNEYRIFAAQAYSENNDWPNAARNYTLYLEKFPNDYATWNALGNIHERAGNYPDAINATLIGYKLAGNNFKDFKKLAKLYEKNKDLQDASIWYHKALELTPNDKDVLFSLLKIELAASNYAMAEQHLATLQKHSLSTVDTHFIHSAKEKITSWRQEVEAKKLKEQQQETLFKASLASGFTVQNEEPATEIAETPPTPVIIATNEQPEPTPAAVEEIKPLNTKQSSDYYSEAITCREHGDHPHAIELCWEAINRNDKHANYWSELSHNYYETEQWNDAESSALEAMKREPLEALHALNYLKILKISHPQEQYILELKKTHHRFPHNPRLLLQLASWTYKNESNNIHARLLYEDFLTHHPNHPAAPTVKERLKHL